MISNYRMLTLFIACFLGVLLFSTNSYSTKPQVPLKLSIAIDSANVAERSIEISIYAYTLLPFYSGDVILKVIPPDAASIDIDVKPEDKTILWSGAANSSFDKKLKIIITDLPKGRHELVAVFQVFDYREKLLTKRESLCVEVSDKDIAWSNISLAEIERERTFRELKKRGFDVKRGAPIDTNNLPDDLKNRILGINGSKTENANAVAISDSTRDKHDSKAPLGGVKEPRLKILKVSIEDGIDNDTAEIYPITDNINSSSKPGLPLKISIKVDSDTSTNSFIGISIFPSCALPFKNGVVTLKVPAIGMNQEHTTVLWSGDSDNNYSEKFEKVILDLPKGRYRFIAEFKANPHKGKNDVYAIQKLYVHVGDSDIAWSNYSFRQIEIERILMELKRLGIEPKKGTIIDTAILPVDLIARIKEANRVDKVFEIETNYFFEKTVSDNAK